MQKKFIALAIAAAFSAPALADNSNVNIYGVANVSYDIVDTGSDTAGRQAFSSNKVSSNTSRLGLKGAEDLGDGLSAIWQIEQLVSLDNAGGTLGTRNTYAGLKSNDAGTVLLGRHDTPYNISTRRFDVFTDGIADNRSILGGGRATAANTAPAAAAATVGASFDGRQPDVLAYISPSLNGLTGAIAYVAGAEAQATSAQTKGSAWSLAGWYDVGGLYASLGYEVHNIGNAPGTVGNTALAAGTSAKESAWKLGVSYKFIDALTASLAYERTSDNFGAAGANALGHNAYYLSGKYAFGNDAVKLAYSKASANATANTGASQISLGYDHSLSKRTTVYAQYTQLSNESAGVYNLFSATNATGSPANALATAGSKPSAFSFGLKHTF
ncbi:MAG TPA: porin [Gallionella sp.]|nr:porin [Gallionella sp.]